MGLFSLLGKQLAKAGEKAGGSKLVARLAEPISPEARASFDKTLGLQDQLAGQTRTNFTAPAILGPEAAANARGGKFPGLADFEPTIPPLKNKPDRDLMAALLTGGAAAGAGYAALNGDEADASPLSKLIVSGATNAEKLKNSFRVLDYSLHPFPIDDPAQRNAAMAFKFANGDLNKARELAAPSGFSDAETQASAETASRLLANPDYRPPVNITGDPIYSADRATRRADDLFGTARDAFEKGDYDASREAYRNALFTSETSDRLLQDDFRPKLLNALPPLALGAAGAGAAMLANPQDADASPLTSALKGIRAFHGSPHLFDKFDLSKIGTGEGAQAYGHGLYFAGNERVARSYRDQLTHRFNTQRVGHRLGETDLLPPFPIAPEQNEKLLIENGISPEVAKPLSIAIMRHDSPQGTVVDSVKQMIGAGRDDLIPPTVRNDVLEAAKNIKTIIAPPLKGSMYEVNLDVDPDSMLDWDKPLRNQPKKTRDALYDAHRTMVGEYALPKYVSDLAPRSAAQVKALADAGIPGIQYLDAGSRAAGDGSRNYVMFDDKPIEILRRYGVPGAIGLGAGAAAALDPGQARADTLSDDGYPDYGALAKSLLGNVWNTVKADPVGAALDIGAAPAEAAVDAGKSALKGDFWPAASFVDPSMFGVDAAHSAFDEYRTLGGAQELGQIKARNNAAFRTRLGSQLVASLQDQ